MSVNPLNSVRAGSIGVALEHVEVRIVDTENRVLPDFEVGELIVKGPNVMKGYFNQPEITEKTIVKKWLHTGDLAYKDSEGYIYVVDRLKILLL